MMFKKGQVVRSHVTNRVFVVVGDDGETFVSVQAARRRPIDVPRTHITLIGNNVKVKPLKPRDATKAAPNSPMAGIPQRSAEEAPPRHGAVTDKLREMMDAVVEKELRIKELEKQVRRRDAVIGFLQAEVATLRLQLDTAQRKKKWWQL